MNQELRDRFTRYVWVGNDLVVRTYDDETITKACTIMQSWPFNFPEYVVWAVDDGLPQEAVDVALKMVVLGCVPASGPPYVLFQYAAESIKAAMKP